MWFGLVWFWRNQVAGRLIITNWYGLDWVQLRFPHHLQLESKYIVVATLRLDAPACQIILLN